MDLSLPPTSSLDSSWRIDNDPYRRGMSKDREVIWDVGGASHDADRHRVPFVLPASISGGGAGALADDGGKGKGREVVGGRNDPPTAKVLANLMDTSKGRDKVLKCLQYSLKTYLYLLSLVARLRPLSPWFTSNSKRVKLAISGLSLTRKCLLLLGPLHPLTELMSPEPMSPRTLVSHLIDLFSALSDDVFCLSKLGLVGRRTGALADKWANRFWLLTTVMGLYKLHLKTIPKIVHSHNGVADRGKLSEAKWTNRKLLADLAFVSYDVFELDWPVLEEPMKCLTGLVAGLISVSKLYGKEWEASIGKG
ncbi:hypothetical protein IAU60_002487 [Kwoniella sp. DSM 27419]